MRGASSAERLAVERGLTLVPPYDDPEIIAGQGTCGLEIVEDLPTVTEVLVPVSGGGLISGVAAAVKALAPEARVIGVEPEDAADARESFLAGEIRAWTTEQTHRSIADGLRVNRLGNLPWAHIQALVSDIVTVSDDEMREAMRQLRRARAPGDRAIGRRRHGCPPERRCRTNRRSAGDRAQRRERRSGAISVHPRRQSRVGVVLMAATGDQLRPVTALFADITGSTGLGERLAPDEVKALIGECVTRMSRAVEEFGGTVQAYQGDGICAYFGVPVAHEDDPQRAARAAFRILELMTEYGREAAAAWGVDDLSVRIGINGGRMGVGKVGAADPQTVALGDATNVAARLEAAAQPGSILVGEETARRLAGHFQVEPRGPVTVKGREQAVDAWVLVAPMVAGAGRHRTGPGRPVRQSWID